LTKERRKKTKKQTNKQITSKQTKQNKTNNKQQTNKRKQNKRKRQKTTVVRERGEGGEVWRMSLRKIKNKNCQEAKSCSHAHFHIPP
jgi:hypothetical protein